MGNPIDAKLKIQAPIPEILPDDPFKNDLLNRHSFCESLISLYSNTSDPLIVSVDANWGDGKTTFAKMMIAELKRQKKHCIYFDAYRHDHTADPFLAFCAEIEAFIDDHSKQNGSLVKIGKTIREKAVAIGIKIGGIGARIATKYIAAKTAGLADGKALTDAAAGLNFPTLSGHPD